MKQRRECVKIDKNAFNYSKIDFGLYLADNRNVHSKNSKKE